MNFNRILRVWRTYDYARDSMHYWDFRDMWKSDVRMPKYGLWGDIDLVRVIGGKEQRSYLDASRIIRSFGITFYDSQFNSFAKLGHQPINAISTDVSDKTIKQLSKYPISSLKISTSKYVSIPTLRGKSLMPCLRSISMGYGNLRNIESVTGLREFWMDAGTSLSSVSKVSKNLSSLEFNNIIYEGQGREYATDDKVSFIQDIKLLYLGVSYTTFSGEFLKYVPSTLRILRIDNPWNNFDIDNLLLIPENNNIIALVMDYSLWREIGENITEQFPNLNKVHIRMGVGFGEYKLKIQLHSKEVKVLSYDRKRRDEMLWVASYLDALPFR